MSMITLTKDCIDRTIEENTPLSVVAEAVRRDMPHLIDRGYSVHMLYNRGLHLENRANREVNTSEDTLKLNALVHGYSTSISQSLIGGLVSDLEHRNVINPETLIADKFYMNNLNKLNGQRKGTVHILNSLLERYNIPDEYRFS